MIATLQACRDCHRPAKLGGVLCEQCQASTDNPEPINPAKTCGWRPMRFQANNWGEVASRRGGNAKDQKNP